MREIPIDLTTSSLEGPVTLEWIRSLPKAELHLHLLGAIRPATAFELAHRYATTFPARTPQDWRRHFATGDLALFVDSFIGLFDLLRTEEEFFRVAWEVSQDLAKEGIRYAEPRVTLTSHLSRSVPMEAIQSGLSEAAMKAKRELGLTLAWVVDFPRILGVETAQIALREAIRGRDWGVVGFDVAGYEGPGITDDELAKVYSEARSAGLGATAHAGEVGNPAHVWAAIDRLKVDRIGHGVRAAEDEALLGELAKRCIPIETNPTCNVLLGAVSSIATHPLELFRQRGIPISINTDDPSLFGITLTEEIHLVAKTFNWTRGQVLEVVGNAWRSRFLENTEGSMDSRPS
jgi:adenosine deaminase